MQAVWISPGTHINLNIVRGPPEAQILRSLKYFFYSKLKLKNNSSEGTSCYFLCNQKAQSICQKTKNKKTKNPFKNWSRLKRSKSLKNCPILVWETRSNVACSASMAASTAIVCVSLDLEKNRARSSADCPSSRPQRFHCSFNSLHASLLQSRAAVSLCVCSPRAPLFPTRWILPWNSCAAGPIHCDWDTTQCGVLTLTLWLMCYSNTQWGYLWKYHIG